MRPTEQPLARIDRFNEYKSQLNSSMHACRSKCDQFNKLMFTISELLSIGIESVRDRKFFNFAYNSSAIEAAYEILNSITKPPEERPHEVLLIKFATAFVPFMEELHGYHPGPEIAFASNLLQKPNVDLKEMTVLERLKPQQQMAQPRIEPIRKAPRLTAVKGMKATSSVLSQIKRALDLPAPAIDPPPAKKPRAMGPASSNDSNAAVMPPSSQHQLASTSSTHYPMNAASTSTIHAYPQVFIKEEEDTSWIKEEELEYDERGNFNFSTYPPPGNDGQSEIPMEIKYEEIKEEPMEEPIADTFVFKSAREEEEDALMAMQSNHSAHHSGTITHTGKEQKPMAKRHEMRLSTFAKHHYSDMFKKSKAPAPVRLPPPSPLIHKALTLVPKQQVPGSCRYCRSFCLPGKMENHVKSCHKDHWLKFVKKCPEKECDFRSDKDEDIDSHRETVHNAQYTLWKLTACSSRFKLQKKANSVMQLSKECPFCPEQLKSLTHLVGHMELLHRRFCSYENPIFECARKGCKRKTARCHEMFQHWHESPGCKDGLKFDYVEARKIAKIDMAKKREEYGIAASPCYPVTEQDE